MSIRKFFVVIGVSNTILLGLVLAIGIWQSKGLEGGMDTLLKRDQQILLNLNNLLAQGLQTGQATRNILLNPSDGKAKENYQKAHEEFMTTLGDLQKMIEGKGKDSLEKIKQAYEEDHKLKLKIQELAVSGEKDKGLKMLGEETQKWRQLKELLLPFIKDQKKETDERTHEIIRHSGVQRTFLIILVLAEIAAFTGLIVFVSRTIRKDLDFALKCIDLIGHGDLSVEINQTSRNEIGQLLEAVKNMLFGLKDLVKKITSGTDTLASSSTELTNISKIMSGSAEQTSMKANAVSGAVEQMSSNMNAVAASMEQTSTNIHIVATSAEEMTSTIGEIARNSEKARAITSGAVDRVNDATQKISDLGQAARDIGKVTETISAISAQTNLLALNATIEAARAGSAGKGFAVVANEIKELAQQTAGATDDIKTRIEGIQSSTSTTVTDIDRISQVIQEVNEIVSTIAAAIEEQSVVTRDIASNVAQAAQGVQEVNQNVAQTSNVANTVVQEIVEVNQASGEVSSSSSQILLSSEELTRLAEQLRAITGKFKI
jgi:methyl-accepting chemotaxis protein